MKNCHSDMLAFHDDRVTLGETARKEMRQRRDSNRDRVKAGLKRDEEPAAKRLRSQGSYAMRTMVQDADNDYDVDDGVYFGKEDLVGPKGGDRTAGAAKEMVRKAVHDERFNTSPDVRTNCVRIYYNEGYHVDLPVYRITQEETASGTHETFELASTDWTTSDPSAVTDWFTSTNDQKSPNKKNGGQFRRVTRLLKAFARSRTSWKDRIATGFMITKLLEERFVANDEREDESVYNSLKEIRNRLQGSLEVDHPTNTGEKLTKGPDDSKTRFLREKLDWAIDELNVLFDPDCTVPAARKAWDKVFNTDFFSGRGDDGGDGNGGGSKAISAAAIIGGRRVTDAVDKQGGGKYAGTSRL